MSRLCLHEENCRDGTEVSVKITCDVFHRRKYHVWKGACMAMLERRLNSKEENKREEKEERRGVVKVGGAIT